MSFIQNFFTSRDNNANATTYVGQQDRIWYNPITTTLYVSDGTTPGGIPINLATGANITANVITVNTITSTSGTVAVTGNLSVSGNISPASNVKIGGISAGPGVVISNQGELTIDTANLPLSFGNFTASNNVLSIVNVDENMILQTEGNAEIQLIGNVGFYRPDGIPPDVGNRYFSATSDGQIFIYVSNADPLLGAVEIIGSTSGQSVSPAVSGVMLHITGQNDLSSSIYNDGIGNVPSYIGRRYNGNAVTPTQVLSGQSIVRFSGQGYSTGGFNPPADGTISLDALENFTQTAQGAIWRFLVNPVGGNTRQEVANISVANGVNATKFTTSGTISATGNITGGNIVTVGNVNASYVNVTQDIQTNYLFASANIGGGNVVITGTFYGAGASTVGTIIGGNISTAGFISATGNVSAGNVNAYVTLPAGTTSKAPLVFTAGPILAVASPGAMDYDGNIFYATPSNGERGLIRTAQTYVPNANVALLNQSTTQSMFGVSASVTSNTRYGYSIYAIVYKTANNITLDYALDGNAVLARHTYQATTTATAGLATLTTPSFIKNAITTGFSTQVPITAALNGTGYYSLQITGLINVTTGGTWNPLVAFSGLPGAGSVLLAGSSVEIWPLGPGNATVNIGSWA